MATIRPVPTGAPEVNAPSLRGLRGVALVMVRRARCATPLVTHTVPLNAVAGRCLPTRWTCRPTRGGTANPNVPVRGRGARRGRVTHRSRLNAVAGINAAADAGGAFESGVIGSMLQDEIRLAFEGRATSARTPSPRRHHPGFGIGLLRPWLPPSWPLPQSESSQDYPIFPVTYELEALAFAFAFRAWFVDSCGCIRKIRKTGWHSVRHVRALSVLR